MLNFTLKQLRYVEAAGRLQSIAHAAAEQSISQSSIAAAIQALEGGLGYDLFIRTPSRGICETPRGREALTQVRRFLQQARQFEAEIQSSAGEMRGSIRIACYATAAPSFLPVVLRSITEKFPQISVTILEGSLARMIEYLNEGQADLAFTYAIFSDPRHHFEPLFEAPVYAVVPSGDPIADKKTTSMAELAKRPLVLLDLPGAREYYRSLLEDTGHQFKIAHSTRSSEILRALVAAGFGVSFLNIRPLDYRENESGYKIVPISDAPKAPEFGIATVAASKPPPIVAAFIQNCRDLQASGAFDALIIK